jgi:hypothetical protein
VAVSIYNTATEYVANAITITRGSISDILTVGVYHNVNPATIPDVTDFVIVTLVNGNTIPLPALAETGFIDILSLIGSKAGADLPLTPGDYQRWCLIQTTAEDIIRKVDTITIL